jgi:hypothetical protein
MVYSITADPKVKDDLKEARDFLNSRRKGFGKKFLMEYRATLKNLQNLYAKKLISKELFQASMKELKTKLRLGGKI